MVVLYTALFVSGMRVALRTPLRALGFDPAPVVRYTSGSALKGLARQDTRALPSAWTPGLSRSNASNFLPRDSRAPFSTKAFRLSGSQETASGQGKKKQSGADQSGKKWIKYGIIGGVITVGAVTFSGDARHFYRAAERSGRVVGTLAVCINE